VHKFGSGAIAKVVTLSEEWFKFMCAGEFVLPPMGVTPGGGEEARVERGMIFRLAVSFLTSLEECEWTVVEPRSRNSLSERSRRSVIRCF